jgi:hypothetical protein
MSTFFLTCAILGGGIVVIQFVLGVVGGHMLVDADDAIDTGVHDGLDLRSIRALSAGLAFFGVGGLLGLQLGIGAVLATVLAIAAGGVASTATAAALRAIRRLERDGTVSLQSAVGTSGTVYVSIPGERSGAGKVHLSVQNRFMECAAVTPGAPLATGTIVLVIDVSGSDTLVVVPNPTLIEESDAAS